MEAQNMTETDRTYRRHQSFRRSNMGRIAALLLFSPGLSACGSDVSRAVAVAEGNTTESPSDEVGLDLTIQSNTLLWGYPNNFQPAPAAGQTISACFLDPAGDGLDSQKQLVKDVVYRTWEFAANVHIDWVDPCPATGSLIRIGIQGRAVAGAGWSVGVGTQNVKGPNADNFADQSCSSTCPSIKVWAANDPLQSDLDIVAYTAAHEFGHALGFQHEQDSPLNLDSNGNHICLRNVGSVKTAVTAYDRDSVMNYCGSLTGAISSLDIVGSQQLYGQSKRYQAVIWLSTSWG